jgi:hypothetical protein
MTRTRITQPRLWGNALLARLPAKINQRPRGQNQKDSAMRNETEIMGRLAEIERRLERLESGALKRRELASNLRLKKLQRPKSSGGR